MTHSDPLLPRTELSWFRRLYPWGVMLAGTLLLVGIMRATGRIWWCECGRWNPWTADAFGSHNSQHLFDPYTFSHFLHGVVFACVLNWGWLRRNWRVQLSIAVLIEIGWELLENSPIIIERYRAGTAAVGYMGDSVGNAVGDVISCMLGWYIGRKIGIAWSIALYVAIELALVLWIRDNLTLNVLMLVYPLDAVRNWQQG